MWHLCRFHKIVQKSLGAQKSDVVELHQELSPSMLNIQTAILECLEATVSELKRSSAAVSGAIALSSRRTRA